MRVIVIDETDLDRPPLVQAALGPALLGLLDEGSDPDVEYLRLYRTAPTVGFTGRDCVTPGIAEAVAAARDQGFAAVRRAPGGRAAGYHGGCVCLDHVGRFGAAGRDIEARFARFADLLAAALRDLTVPAEVGELPGEFCPGPFSVHDTSGRKLVGSAQRLTRAGWLFSTVVVLDDPEPLRAVLTPVYGALGVAFAPGTVGAVTDSTPGVSRSTFTAALLQRLTASAGVEHAALPAGVVERAQGDLERHRTP